MAMDSQRCVPSSAIVKLESLYLNRVLKRSGYAHKIIARRLQYPVVFVYLCHSLSLSELEVLHWQIDTARHISQNFDRFWNDPSHLSKRDKPDGVQVQIVNLDEFRETNRTICCF
jgi:hypothetical protein